MLEMLKPYASLISAGSALISALAVLVSTYFIIWTTYFRKTRRDRMDELKEEIQVMLSDGWAEKIIGGTNNVEDLFKALKPKLKKTEYKRLHQCAFDELGYEGKNEVINMSKKKEEDHRYMDDIMRKQKENMLNLSAARRGASK